MRVLLLEDDSAVSQNIKDFFRSLSHEVTQASSVDEAFDLFQTNDFPLIVLEGELKGTDGLELCRRIRASRKGNDAFILVNTSLTGDLAVEKILSAGANDYISKGATLAELGVRVRVATQLILENQKRKQTEEEFFRIQRLKNLGVLASGIAHDLNNVLSPVLMGVQLLQAKLKDSASQKLLSTMEKSVRRGAEMVKQILSFSKGSDGDEILVSPSSLLKEILAFSESSFPRRITIKSEFPSNLSLIHCNPTQLYQAMINLMINARDSMPKGGVITVKAANIELDAKDAGEKTKPGPHVVISVTDTGVGIPPELLQKITEAFYTTKKDGKGTGLGLSIVTSMLRSFGGFMTVESEVGVGSTFKLFFPRAQSKSPRVMEITGNELPSGHGELVLVVDDELSILEISKTTLEAYGYQVLTASDGVSAVALLEEHSKNIRVVLVDMMMPYLDGAATIQMLQQSNPRVKIIAMTGMVEGHAFDMSSLGISSLLKPHTTEELLKAINKSLSDSQTV